MEIIFIGIAVILGIWLLFHAAIYLWVLFEEYVLPILIFCGVGSFFFWLIFWIFVQSDERSDDGFKSLKERADGCEVLKKEIVKKKKADRDLCAKIACEEWTDVRSFGQVFAFKGEEASFGVRGPVSIHQAVSLSPVNVISMQIVKSVNSEAGKESKASDTMGTKHRVGFAVYKVVGSVNVQLAEKTGFTQEDAELLKECLKTLFENDASSARPEGSLEVCKMYWWQLWD